MKILLSIFLCLTPSIWGVQLPWFAPRELNFSHDCAHNAYTTLLIADDQPRSILKWVGERVYIDPTAMVRVEEMDLLVHGYSTILLSEVWHQYIDCPYIECTLRELKDEALAHGYMAADGKASAEIEWLLARWEEVVKPEGPPPELSELPGGVWGNVLPCPTRGLLP